MNWLYTSFLLTHIINHVWTFDASSIPISKSDVSIEIPKPIIPLDFAELDTSYRNPKILKWHADKSKKPSMVDIALDVAAREGIHAMTDLYQNIEPQIVKNGQILEDNHPAALLSKFSAPIEGNEQSAMAAFATLSATKAFRRNNKESAVLGRQAQSQKVSFRRTPLESLCPPRDPPICMPASQRYRTHDGTCNNRRRLRWGSAQMPFNRFLPPEYGDGVDSIRGSVESGALSSARFVSLLVHGAREGNAPLTLMIVQWGQLLDHDMTSTAQPRSINGSVPSCCGSKDFHPLCFPIKVPLDDPWLAPLKVRCLEFLRSAPAQRRDCVLSWREQTNQVTSYIDASPIYSSNAKTSDNARIFRNGLLIYGRGDPADDVCMRGAIAHQCIRSGDGRSGEQPGLLALHHVWVGEHNRIAMELSILNPHWSDEKVYQETRRIIGALFQHITFREFLPIVLGREVCKLFDLELVKSGYYSGYDSNVNPSMSNAFSAAAFRFGHSLVQNTYMRADRNHNFINNNVTLHEEFQQGDIGTAGSLHRLIRGLASQKALKRDEFITPQLTNHLFQTPGFPFGLDLAAINIQRGRDHGIAPYTAWRQPCGLSAINSWDDLTNVVGPESSKRISHAYRNVHDIDLFVGGIAERPVIGGLVGPTFACIIAQQFSNSRKGDRFWYENSGFESSFTPAQLNALRHVSLSSVLCRAVNGGTLQPYVFLPHDVKGNQRVKCGKEALEPIDLRPWLEQDPFLMSNNEKIDKNVSPQSITPLNQSTVKEEKGINNRIQNLTMVANVDFIPNSSIGFHRVTNMTKIHDKLDMAQKLAAVRPSLKPIRGISNKLDKNRLTVKKNPKHTSSALSKRISTTRRTVVIHNVQIELRSANGATNKELKEKRTDHQQQNSMVSTAQNTILKVAGVVKSQISAAMGFLSANNDDNNDDDTSTKHLSRKMNDQTEALTRKLTNFTKITNNITEPGTFIQTDTTNNNLTAGRLLSSDNELKVESSSDKPNTELVTNDNQDEEATSLATNVKSIRQNPDKIYYKALTKTDISNKKLNITKNLTRPTKLTNTTKDLNKADHVGEELTNSKIETSPNFLNPDLYTQPVENSNNSHDKTDFTNNCTITNNNIVSERNDSKTPTKADNHSADGNTANQMTTDQNNKHSMTDEQLNEDFSDNLRNKLDDTFNSTNNINTQTKWTNSAKEINKTDHAEEELTNSKIKTSTIFLNSDPCIENSDKTNVTDNCTITKSFIDSERNNSKTPIKQNFEDINDLTYKLNENTAPKMTTDQNKEHLIMADRSTSFESNLNDEQLNEDFSGNLKEKLDESFNITNNLTTHTKLTNPTKELNKTNLLNPDPCTQNIETSKYNNDHTDLTNNCTNNNNTIDSEGNDSKTPTKADNHSADGNTANQMTTDQNNKHSMTDEQHNEDFSDNLRNKLDDTFNSTNNIYTPTKRTNSAKEKNKTDHAEEELTNSKIKTSTIFLNSDPCIENSDKTNVTDNCTITKSFIDSERNNSKTPIKLNENTAPKMTTDQNKEHLIMADRSTSFESNLNDEQLNEDFSGNLKEKLDESFNITNNLTTHTKLTNPTKELNKTNLLNPDPCTQNIETSKYNNDHTDLTNNCTNNNNTIDSEGNDSKTLTKEAFKDSNNLAYILNGKTAKQMTIGQNNEYLINSDGSTSVLPLDQSYNGTFVQSNLNDQQLNEDDFSDNSKETHDTYKDFQDLINSALQDSLDQHKRVHRKTDHKNVQVEKVEFHTNLDFIDKLRTLRLGKTNDYEEIQLTGASKLDRKSEEDLNENYFTESDDLTLPINTEQPSATLRNIELRQYQERPIYNRPSQQLLIDTPKSDQYEIEINIRQTNKKKPQNNANYEDYNSPNKRYDKDRYNHQYDYTTYPHQNSPSSNGFFTPTTRIPYGTRTKPPTIIYIDEHDVRSTTRAPGIFQNIISFATSGLNSIKQQTTSTKSPFNHNPNRIINSGQNSVSENYLSSHSSWPYQNSKPSSSNYLGGQQGQTYPPTQGFPQHGQHGFPQGPSNFNPAVLPPQGFPHQNIYPPQALPGANSFSTASNIGGVSHASSNAVSTGHFGAIVGSASSSGGDSTFSFNIRPSPRPQLNLMSPEGIKPDYEFLPQHRPQFSSTPSYAFPPKPMLSASVESFDPNKNDPFSSYTGRPPSYFNKPTNVFDSAYDDIGRSELIINDAIDHDHHKTNQTNEDFESDDYDYNDDDDDRFGHIFKNNNAVNEQSSGKIDKIDYLKLAEQALTNRTKLNTTELDDNFVLPVLRRSDTFIEAEEDLTTMTLMTGEQKSLGHDILAEDYDELLTARSSFLDSQTSHVTGQWNRLTKSPPPSVAFAPIQILTKPERPDNWVIFDALDEQPLVPMQPDFNTDTLVAAEVPMPIQKRKISRTSTKTPQTTKPTDINFSTDTLTFDMTTTSEQSLDEFTTEAKIDDLTTSVENLTHELDEITTETTQPINTTSENSDLKIEKDREDLLSFETENSNEKIDHKQTEHSTDIPAQR